MARRSAPNERLGEYRKSRQLFLEDLAKSIGCAPSTLSALIIGTRRPGLRLALQIEHVTGIEAADWVRRAS